LNLDIFKKIGDNLKNDENIQNFINEVGEYLENRTGLNDINDFINNLKSERSVSLISENKIRKEAKNILEDNKEDGMEILENKANQILEEQDQELEEYRKEGHLYFVEENRNDRIYITDITEKSDYSVEEPEIADELKKRATEGTVIQYKNGAYEFYSEDGYEMLEN
jgi:hypothetical protein